MAKRGQGTTTIITIDGGMTVKTIYAE